MYAAGSTSVGGQRHAVVRRAADGGWLTADDLTADGGAVATAVALGPGGQPFAGVGLGLRSPGCAWVVRTLLDGGWTMADDFGYPASQATVAYAVAVTPSGEVLVAGHALTRALPLRWLVRKQLPVCP